MIAIMTSPALQFTLELRRLLGPETLLLLADDLKRSESKTCLERFDHGLQLSERSA